MTDGKYMIVCISKKLPVRGVFDSHLWQSCFEIKEMGYDGPVEALAALDELDISFHNYIVMPYWDNKQSILDI